MRRKIVAGNWKMNTSLEEGITLIDEIIKRHSTGASNDNVLKIIAPPFTHLLTVSEKLKSLNGFEVAAQNCHHLPDGAYTGEVSAKMIASTGSKYIIIGHSERRMYFGENNTILSQKVNVALSNNLTPIFCIGENLAERNGNNHLETIKKQLEDSLFNLSALDFNKLIIAYEPIWAIGTGNTATCTQVQEIHHFIRSEIEKKYGKEISSSISILYGGSCNAQNAKELFVCNDVDGGLIGGASLKAADFIQIINSF
jgi:triosephosphate isomerase (TIM)